MVERNRRTWILLFVSELWTRFCADVELVEGLWPDDICRRAREG